jgi:hypothetical protein
MGHSRGTRLDGFFAGSPSVPTSIMVIVRKVSDFTCSMPFPSSNKVWDDVVLEELTLNPDMFVPSP